MRKGLGNSFRSIFQLSLFFVLIFSSPYSSLFLLQLADTDGLTSSYVAHGELHLALEHEHHGHDTDHQHGIHEHDTAHEKTPASDHGFADFAHSSQTEHPHQLHLTAERFYPSKTFGVAHTRPPLVAIPSVASDFFSLWIPTTPVIPPEYDPPGLCSELQCLRTTVLLI